MQFQLLLAVISIVEARDPFLNKAKPYSQEFYDSYNFLKFTGGEGPYSQRRGVGINRDTPTGCRVDQAVMLHRHGERYPSTYDSTEKYTAWQSIVEGHDKFEGDLEFLNWWKPVSNKHTGLNGAETEFGAYAGTLGAYSNGVDYRRRYNHLYDPDTILPIFASGYERVVVTARKFGEGFLGYNYTNMAAMQIIPETSDQGANTIDTSTCDGAFDLPTRCKMPSDDDYENYDNGWIPIELENAAKRLNHFHGLNITGSDVTNLMGTAAFEVNIRGDSPWISVFSSEEWVAYEYFQSAYYYCYWGPLANATPYRGSVFLNATRTLLNQGPEESLPLALTFGHDTDITPVVSLLGFANVTDFDPTEVAFGLPWDITDIVPQSAHLVFERLIYEDPEYLTQEAWDESAFVNAYPMVPASNSAPNSTARYAANYTYPMGSNKTDALYYGNLTANSTYVNSSIANSYEYSYGQENIYIRIVLNDAVVPLPGCSSGPGKSCKLSGFNELVDKALEGYNYFETCIQPQYPDAPQYLDFFWTWNQTNINDYDPDALPYQAKLVDYLGQPI